MILRPLHTGLPPPQADDEAKPTAAELKEAFSSHISQRHGPDAPLMTQAMRQREEARLGIKKKEYHEVSPPPTSPFVLEDNKRPHPLRRPRLRVFLLKQIRIRIRLSDRTTLEGTFPSTAQVPTLYCFLRAHLSHRHARHAFTLYQSPPKRDLPESTKDVKLQGKTLRELGMAPAAVVLVRWSDTAMNSNTYPAPLSDETLVLAQDLPTPPSFGAQSAGQTLQDPSSAAAAKDKEESASSGTKKVGAPSHPFLFPFLLLFLTCSLL